MSIWRNRLALSIITVSLVASSCGSDHKTTDAVIDNADPAVVCELTSIAFDAATKLLRLPEIPSGVGHGLTSLCEQAFTDLQNRRTAQFVLTDLKTNPPLTIDLTQIIAAPPPAPAVPPGLVLTPGDTIPPTFNFSAEDARRLRCVLLYSVQVLKDLCIEGTIQPPG